MNKTSNSKVAKSEDSAKSKPDKTKSAIEQLLNYRKCCTCKYFPHKIHGEVQPCTKSKKYVARKAEMPCYKCKIEA